MSKFKMKNGKGTANADTPGSFSSLDTSTVQGLNNMAFGAGSKLEKETGFGTKGYGESKKVNVLGAKLTNVPTYDKSAEERGLEKGYKLLESSARGKGPYVGETMEELKKRYTPQQAKQKLMSTNSARSVYEADLAYEKATGGLTIPQTGPVGQGFVTRKNAFQPHTLSQPEFESIATRGDTYYKKARHLDKMSEYGGKVPGLKSMIEKATSKRYMPGGVRKITGMGPEISNRAFRAVVKRQEEKVKEQKTSLTNSIMKEQFRKNRKPVSITIKGLANPRRK